MRRAALVAVASAMLAAVPAAVAAPRADAGMEALQDGAMVRVVLKFVKRDAGPGVRFDPVTCPACTPVTDAYWNADTARETVVALSVPRRRTLELGFDGGTANVRRVLLESGELG